jgi:hypothetical protein
MLLTLKLNSNIIVTYKWQNNKEEHLINLPLKAVKLEILPETILDKDTLFTPIMINSRENISMESDKEKESMSTLTAINTKVTSRITKNTELAN